MLKKSSLQKFTKSPPLPFKNLKIQDRTTPIKSQNNPFACDVDSTKIRIEHLQNNLKQQKKQREFKYQELVNMINQLKNQKKSKCKHNILVMERSPTHQKISKNDFANNASIASITSNKQRRDSKCGIIKQANWPINTFETIQNSQSRFDQLLSSPKISKKYLKKVTSEDEQLQYMSQRITAIENLVQADQKIIQKLMLKNEQIQQISTKNYQSISRILQAKIEQIIEDNEVLINQIESKFQAQSHRLVKLQNYTQNKKRSSSWTLNENQLLKIKKKLQQKIMEQIQKVRLNQPKNNQIVLAQMRKAIALMQQKLTEQCKISSNQLKLALQKLQSENITLKHQLKSQNQNVQQQFQQLNERFVNFIQTNKQFNQQTKRSNDLKFQEIIKNYQRTQQNLQNQLQNIQITLNNSINELKSKAKSISQQNMNLLMKMNQTELVLEEIKICNYGYDLKLQSLKDRLAQNKSHLQSKLKEVMQSKSSVQIQTKQSIISNSITLIEDSLNLQQKQSGFQSSTQTQFYTNNSSNQANTATSSKYNHTQKMNELENKLQEFMFKWQCILQEKQLNQSTLKYNTHLNSSRYQNLLESLEKRIIDTEDIVQELMKMTMTLTTNLNQLNYIGSSGQKQLAQKDKNSNGLRLLRQQLKPIKQAMQQVSLDQIQISFTEQNSIQNIAQQILPVKVSSQTSQTPQEQ